MGLAPKWVIARKAKRGIVQSIVFLLEMKLRALISIFLPALLMIYADTARAYTIYLICDGYSQYSDGIKGAPAKTALIFDLSGRTVQMKEDAEKHMITDQSEARIAWRSPETPNRLTRSEGQFSIITMTGREFYRYIAGSGGWTNHYENCKETSPVVSTVPSKLKFSCEIKTGKQTVSYQLESGDGLNSLKEISYIVDGRRIKTYNTWTARNTSDGIKLVYDQDSRYSLSLFKSGGVVTALFLRDVSVIGNGYCVLG